MNKKDLFLKYKKILNIFLFIHNIFTIKGKRRGLFIKGLGNCIAKKNKIINIGKNNILVIGEMTTLDGLDVYINGNNNIIKIGDRCLLKGCKIWIEDDNNTLEINNHTYVYNDTELAVIEGTAIVIGEDCLIAPEVRIRTGDSHTIFEISKNERINKSEKVTIGSHVWIGNRAVVLKGSNIEEHSVVGSSALVTKKLLVKRMLF